MFGSSKSTGGQPLERVKAADPISEQFDDIPPMPEGFTPPNPAAPARKAFNFAEKPKPAPKPVPAEDAAHLYIGANIRLKGELAGCEVMRVDGVYEGIAKARRLVLCPGGTFAGTADIEEAEIEGAFEGTLLVRGRLFLRKNGRIRGTFSYGELEIERGGEIDGRILPLEKKPAAAKPAFEAAKPAEPPKPAASAAPVVAAAPARPAAPPRPVAGASPAPAA
ncbi:bactofilin family protein [Rhizomicrobium electricum]|uniref:Polymer-forming cytoskeletal protein n=1 Tax=Rhizomicrobium electricum TaxID=480070 RepID=A0ABN1F8A1_9PROT|nr:polymer-forming cytoskeletal protein [Rhizomicrobium electricum]NIJ46748.1 cytoskeletal protein CcmA (bactofilin family) [Rhizomicrobium electricum]